MATSYRPVWMDNSSRDPDVTRAFYGGLFGWQMVTSDDPQYGGYATATRGGKAVAGFIGHADPNMPASNWNLYIASPDAAATAAAATAAGGTVVMAPFAIGDMGTSAFIRDPSGAMLGVWQAASMVGFETQGLGAYGWGELNARGVGPAIPFYEQVFGWTQRTSDMGNGTSYTEFLDGEESLLGAQEMAPQLPASVPSFWLVYFAVADVAATNDAAVAAGAGSMVPATDFSGGTFAILTDPQGGAFGLLKMA